MRDLLPYIIEVSGLLSITSLFAIGFYLKRNKIYTLKQLRRKVLWPEIIFQYRDHTKIYSKKTGSWFYIFSCSILILLLSGTIEFLLHASSWPQPVMFIVIIVLMLILLIIGYAIYNIGKEKYF
ncbi:MAG: hypothetical protein ACW972_11855 [Promethearchaeota archaeon]|jgi:hypothetical protein